MRVQDIIRRKTDQILESIEYKKIVDEAISRGMTPEEIERVFVYSKIEIKENDGVLTATWTANFAPAFKRKQNGIKNVE